MSDSRLLFKEQLWVGAIFRIRSGRLLVACYRPSEVATRYDKTALLFASFLNLAAARLLLKSFVNAA